MDWAGFGPNDRHVAARERRPTAPGCRLPRERAAATETKLAPSLHSTASRYTLDDTPLQPQPPCVHTHTHENRQLFMSNIQGRHRSDGRRPGGHMHLRHRNRRAGLLSLPDLARDRQELHGLEGQLLPGDQRACGSHDDPPKSPTAHVNPGHTSTRQIDPESAAHQPQSNPKCPPLASTTSVSTQIVSPNRTEAVRPPAPSTTHPNRRLSANTDGGIRTAHVAPRARCARASNGERRARRREGQGQGAGYVPSEAVAEGAGLCNAPRPSASTSTSPYARGPGVSTSRPDPESALPPPPHMRTQP